MGIGPPTNRHEGGFATESTEGHREVRMGEPGVHEGTRRGTKTKRGRFGHGCGAGEHEIKHVISVRLALAA